MKRILIIMMVLCAAVDVSAQAEDSARQILIFRNTGEVNLFYSNELDSVTTTETAQIFYSADTTLVVPLAELDSVAVGFRNEFAVNKQVHQLTDDIDIPWLIRAEGNSLFYRIDTPANILPKVNERLYYAESCELLPFGLAVKVVSVTLTGNEYEVVVGDVDLAEIFDKLFYAGRVESKKGSQEKNFRRKAPITIPEHYVEPVLLDGVLHLNNIGEILVNGETNVTADFVVNVKRHYYYAHIRGNTEVGFDYTLRSDDSASETISTPNFEIPLPIVAGVLHPVLYANLFIDMTAELRFNYSMKRNYVFDYEWTRENGKNRFESHTPTGGQGQYKDEAKMDILLNGEFFMGATIGLGLNLVGDRAGVRASVQAGPFLNGQLGVGMLSSLRDYNPEYFHKAEINVGLRLRVAASYFDREYFWLFGNEVEHPLYSHDFNINQLTFPLFPDYSQCNATATTKKASEVKTDMAASIEEPTPTDLKTGFEIVDPNGEIVDSVYVGQIEAKPKEEKTQTFEGEIVLPKTIKQEDLDGYTMRPIFHYAGYTVSAKPVGIKKDVNLQPYTSQQSNGAMTFISGAPFLGSAKHDETLYTLGLYMPVPPKKRLKEGAGSPIEPGDFISDDREELIIGTWAGEMDGNNVTITFGEDGNGSSVQEGQTARSFQYELNKPQSGELIIMYDETREQFLWRVLSVNETELKIVDKRDTTHKTVTFMRQY